MSLAKLYIQKYGSGKLERAPASAPPTKPAATTGMQALRRRAPKVATQLEGRREKTAQEKLGEFIGGKRAAAAFLDELRTLNEHDMAELEKRAMRDDKLLSLLKAIG